jgi:hypothetical protein
MSKYFTAAQSTIYINSILADEIFAVSYNETSNTVPVYGYASRKFDAVVRGKSIVEGTIFVYHNKAKYFWVLLSEAILEFVNGNKELETKKSGFETTLRELASGVKTGSISESDAAKKLSALIDSSPADLDILLPTAQSIFNNEFASIRPKNNPRKAYGEDIMDVLTQHAGGTTSARYLSEVDIAGPFRLSINTGLIGSKNDQRPLLVDGVNDCFITGKGTDIANDDKILYKAYTFFGREELKA